MSVRDTFANGNSGNSTFVSGIDYPSPFDQYALELAESALRHLCVLSANLDHRVFDRSELVSAIVQLARSSRNSDIRILVQDPRPLVQRGHRLLGLARRLPSKVRIRVLAEHPQWQGESLLIRDNDGLLFRPADGAAFCETRSRASTRPRLEYFDTLWELAEEHVELRTMRL